MTTDPQTARDDLIAYATATRTVTVDGLDPLIDAYRDAELAVAASAAVPPTDRAGLREPLRRALAETDGFSYEGLEPHDYQRHVDAVLPLLPAPVDRAALLQEAAALIEARQDSLDAEERAEFTHLDHETVLQGEAVRGMAAYLRKEATGTPQPETQAAPWSRTGGFDQHDDYRTNTPAAPETVHACPPEGSGLTPCCRRTPFELPLGDRMSSEAPVTCTAPAVTPTGKEA